MACNGIKNDMSWNRQWSLTGLGVAGFLKNTHSDLDDNGVTSIKVIKFCHTLTKIQGD